MSLKESMTQNAPSAPARQDAPRTPNTSISQIAPTSLDVPISQDISMTQNASVPLITRSDPKVPRTPATSIQQNVALPQDVLIALITAISRSTSILQTASKP